jgi:hypothetical protein
MISHELLSCRTLGNRMLLERRWLPRSHRRYTAMRSNSTIDFPHQLKSLLMLRTELSVVTLHELGHIRVERQVSKVSGKPRYPTTNAS